MRGFTLIELMIVCVISTIVVGACGLLYLEMRVDAAKLDSEVQLTRRASLAMEWMRRDLQSGADSTWSVDGRGLVRKHESAEKVVAPRATALEVKAVDRGHHVRLVLERPLISGRRVRHERAAFVGSRP